MIQLADDDAIVLDEVDGYIIFIINGKTYYFAK